MGRIFFSMWFSQQSNKETEGQDLDSYLWDKELVDDTSLPVVNGDFVSWNWRRVATGSVGDTHRRLELRRRFNTPFGYIRAASDAPWASGLPVECGFPVDRSAGIAGNGVVHRIISL